MASPSLSTSSSPAPATNRPKRLLPSRPRTPSEIEKAQDQWMAHNKGNIPGLWGYPRWTKRPTAGVANHLLRYYLCRGVLSVSSETYCVTFFADGSNHSLFRVHFGSDDDNAGTSALAETTSPAGSNPGNHPASCPHGCDDSSGRSADDNDDSWLRNVCRARRPLPRSRWAADLAVQGGKPFKLPNHALFRIGMPKDPYFVVESEVATMAFAREQGLPVPRVFCFDSSGTAPFGLEAMFLECIEGVQTLHEKRYSSSIQEDQVECLRDTFCQVQTNHLPKLEAKQFDDIGSLYYDWDGGDRSQGGRGYFVGPSVSGIFWLGHRARYPNVHRGPFRNVGEYLNGILSVLDAEINDTTLRTHRNSSWYTVSDISRVRNAILKLRASLLPRLATWTQGQSTLNFARGPTADPSTMKRPYLHHGSLHTENILLDTSTSTSTIKSIIDWEKSTIEPCTIRSPYPEVVIHYEEQFQEYGLEAVEALMFARSKNIPALLRLGEGLADKMLADDDDCRVVMVPVSLFPPERERTGAAYVARLLVDFATGMAARGDDLEAWIERVVVAIDGLDGV